MKRLYRPQKDRKIWGVCSGVARLIGCDPTIVRVAWAIAFLLYGFGGFAYIIGALIIPNEEDIQ